jgi:hypothetical protein
VASSLANGSPFGRLVQTTPAYQAAAIEHGFNWTDALADVPDGEWYLVVFRSRLRPDVDYNHLIELDEQTLEQARTANGFLFYFGGTPDAESNCLSFCLWQNRETAQAATRTGAHRSAQHIAARAYEHYKLERYVVRKQPGSPTVFFEPVQLEPIPY